MCPNIHTCIKVYSLPLKSTTFPTRASATDQLCFPFTSIFSRLLTYLHPLPNFFSLLAFIFFYGTSVTSFLALSKTHSQMLILSSSCLISHIAATRLQTGRRNRALSAGCLFFSFKSWMILMAKH